MVGIASRQQRQQNTSQGAAIGRTMALLGGGAGGGLGGGGLGGGLGGAAGGGAGGAGNFLSGIDGAGGGFKQAFDFKGLISSIKDQIKVQKNESFNFFRNVRDVDSGKSTGFLAKVSQQFAKPTEQEEEKKK